MRSMSISNTTRPAQPKLVSVCMLLLATLVSTGSGHAQELQKNENEALLACFKQGYPANLSCGTVIPPKTPGGSIWSKVHPFDATIMNGGGGSQIDKFDGMNSEFKDLQLELPGF